MRQPENTCANRCNDFVGGEACPADRRRLRVAGRTTCGEECEFEETATWVADTALPDAEARRACEFNPFAGQGKIEVALVATLAQPLGEDPSGAAWRAEDCNPFAGQGGRDRADLAPFHNR